MPAWWTRSARWCAEIMARAHVLVVTRRTTRKNKYIEYVGEYHLDNLIRAGLLPVMIPVVPGTFSCLPQYTEKMKGLLLVEGEDVEPVHYRARRANFRYLEKTDPAKDQIEIRLLRQALRRRLPILGLMVLMAFLLPLLVQGKGDAAAGKAVFAKRCATCHGAAGEGKDAIAKMMKVTFRHLGAKEVQAKSDAELRKDMTEGTGKMKPVAGMTEEEITNLVAYVRTLALKE